MTERAFVSTVPAGTRAPWATDAGPRMRKAAQTTLFIFINFPSCPKSKGLKEKLGSYAREKRLGPKCRKFDRHRACGMLPQCPISKQRLPFSAARRTTNQPGSITKSATHCPLTPSRRECRCFGFTCSDFACVLFHLRVQLEHRHALPSAFSRGCLPDQLGRMRAAGTRSRLYVIASEAKQSKIIRGPGVVPCLHGCIPGADADLAFGRAACADAAQGQAWRCGSSRPLNIEGACWINCQHP
jgi:hypothetical protein